MGGPTGTAVARSGPVFLLHQVTLSTNSLCALTLAALRASEEGTVGWTSRLPQTGDR